KYHQESDSRQTASEQIARWHYSTGLQMRHFHQELFPDEYMQPAYKNQQMRVEAQMPVVHFNRIKGHRRRPV
ncbi:hypothetical protein Q2366_25360, partial [Escherichia coli]|nr:hypothetical protein [Escherichia coli]